MDMFQEKAPGAQKQNNDIYEKFVKESLSTKRMGFQDISANIVGKIIEAAPDDGIFTVPDERHKLTYEYVSKVMKREDLKFVIGK